MSPPAAPPRNCSPISRNATEAAGGSRRPSLKKSRRVFGRPLRRKNGRWNAWRAGVDHRRNHVHHVGAAGRSPSIVAVVVHTETRPRSATRRSISSFTGCVRQRRLCATVFRRSPPKHGPGGQQAPSPARLHDLEGLRQVFDCRSPWRAPFVGWLFTTGVPFSRAGRQFDALLYAPATGLIRRNPVHYGQGGAELAPVSA